MGKLMQEQDQDHDEANIQKKSKIQTKPLALVGLNYDCLEAIFMHLDLMDLINMADTHEHFVPAAILVFSRRYHKKAIYLNLGAVHCNSTIPEINMDLGVAFFRHFGQSVSSLLLNQMDERVIDAEESLLEQCTGSLIDIKLLYCWKAFESIKKPFAKVDNLVIKQCWLDHNLSKLNIWFPNVISLKLKYVNLSRPCSFEVNFSKLKHLMIYISELTKSITPSTISKMCYLNLQLESLIINCDYGVHFLQSISNYLVKLNVLELWLPDDGFYTFFDSKAIFASVKKFTLNYSFKWNGLMWNMPFVFPCLRELKLNGFHKFNEKLLDIVVQTKSIQKLNLMICIRAWDDTYYNELELITKMLPDLIELEFWPNIH